MKIAIIGSRNYENYEELKKTADQLLSGTKTTTIISGGAKGADTLAARYAKERGYRLQTYLPDWEAHGKIAGPLRNAEIIKNCDGLIAYWDGKSRGTKDSLLKALRANKNPLGYYDTTTGHYYNLRE